MPNYRLCGLTLETNVAFPELAAGEPAPVDEDKRRCSFELSSPGCRDLAPSGARWYHERYLPGGQLWLACAKRGSGYLLRFPDLADFLISHDGWRVGCQPASDVPDETLRHLFLDQVFPLAMSVRQRTILHASAVVVEGSAIAFTAETGSGKSTLTASFCAEGFPLLSDDCLLIEEKAGRLWAVPSYAGLRLWPDTVSALAVGGRASWVVAHYTDKQRVAVDSSPAEAAGERPSLRFAGQPAPLRRLYVLAPPHEVAGEPIVIEPLTGSDAMLELVRQVYRLDLTDRIGIRTEFKRLGALAERLIIRRLTFPREFSMLPRVRTAILEEIASLQGR